MFYLRTDISYRYKNGGWLTHPPGEPVIMAGHEEINPGELRKSLEITLLGDLYTRIPLGTETTALALGDNYYSLIPEEFYGASGIKPGSKPGLIPGSKTLLLPGSILPPGDLPLSRGETVTLYEESIVEGIYATGGEPRENTPKENKEDPEAPPQLYAQIMPRIIELGKSLGERDSNLAQSQTQDPGQDRNGQSAYEERTVILNRIQDFLSKGYTYTLETRGSNDPLADFLFQSKKGYCVHFATAGAVLAAENGIPVRMARGFLVTLPGGAYDASITPGEAVVTGYSAHMWPEVLNNNGRWIPWEVTPPMTGLSEEALRLTEDTLTRNQLNHFGLTPDRTGGNGKGIKDNKKSVSDSLLFRAGIISSAGLLFILLFFIYRKFRDRMNPGRVYRRCTMRVQKQTGVAMPDETGWSQWGKTLSNLHPEKSDKINRLTTLILKTVYGGSSPQIYRKEIFKLFRIIEKTGLTKKKN
ncbi:MAG: transglutaminase domain-containing protein [Spirochaetales bacterium]|nr:transglutaminase domain-containing protein [Spirochaetales bacterium]